MLQLMAVHDVDWALPPARPNRETTRMGQLVLLVKRVHELLMCTGGGPIGLLVSVERSCEEPTDANCVVHAYGVSTTKTSTTGSGTDPSPMGNSNLLVDRLDPGMYQRSVLMQTAMRGPKSPYTHLWSSATFRFQNLLPRLSAAMTCM